MDVGHSMKDFLIGHGFKQTPGDYIELYEKSCYKCPYWLPEATMALMDRVPTEKDLVDAVFQNGIISSSHGAYYSEDANWMTFHYLFGNGQAFLENVFKFDFRGKIRKIVLVTFTYIAETERGIEMAPLNFKNFFDPKYVDSCFEFTSPTEVRRYVVIR